MCDTQKFSFFGFSFFWRDEIFFYDKILLCNKFLSRIYCVFHLKWVERTTLNCSFWMRIAGNAKMILFMHVCSCGSQRKSKFMENFYANSFLKHTKNIFYIALDISIGIMNIWIFSTQTKASFRRDWIIFNISRFYSAGIASKLIIFMEKRGKNTFFCYFYSLFFFFFTFGSCFDVYPRKWKTLERTHESFTWINHVRCWELREKKTKKINSSSWWQKIYFFSFELVYEDFFFFDSVHRFLIFSSHSNT